MNQNFETGPRRKFVTERDHVAKLPRRIDMKEGEWQPCWGERLLRQMEHHARVLADRIQQDRIAKLGGRLAKDVNRFRLETAQTDLMMAPIYVPVQSFACSFFYDAISSPGAKIVGSLLTRRCRASSPAMWARQTARAQSIPCDLSNQMRVIKAMRGPGSMSCRGDVSALA